MKNTQSLIALVMLSGIMVSSAFAADTTSAHVKADLQAYQQSGLANLERGEATVDTNSAAYKAAEQRYDTLRGHSTQTTVKTRAEVEADLKAYQQSGLADMEVGNRDVNEFSPQYQHALNKYKQLRSQL